MIHSSRTPSPTKSPRRQALSSKDSNIRQANSPMLKLHNGSTPQLSPARVSKPSSRSPSRSVSPQKNSSPLKNASNIGSAPLTNPPQLGFKIFEDPTDYSTEVRLSSQLAINDENDYASNKENVAPKSPLRGQNSNRTVLGDLDILEHSGYITYHSKHATTLSDPRQGVYQLDTLWRADGLVSIPSYVTPPRKDRVKYISFTQDKVKTKRSNSISDLKEKVVKKLQFDIHRE